MKEVAGYDVIGDIHGYASALEALLKKLDYVCRDGVWTHSERSAVFVGDFVDRGPENLRTCEIVMEMMAGGKALAVMGNHEFNHIAFDTPDPERPGHFLRSHSDKNLNQARTTLAEFERSPAAQARVIAWMRSLPLWLSLPGLRVVHACWNEHSMGELMAHLDSAGAFRADHLPDACRKGHPIRAAREIVLSGPEKQLPPGMFFHDNDGHRRDEARLKWWLLGQPGLTWRDVVYIQPSRATELPDEAVPSDFGEPDADERPVIFGHYWMVRPLELLNQKHACVDASVAKHGTLAAYRFSGETNLRSDNFIYV
jgi:hypothetical protein